MLAAADYRERAEDCLRLAEQAGDDYHRKNYQQLATMWSEMAQKAITREGIVSPDSASPDSEGIDAALHDALATIKNANAN